jgi:hypothetical protein
LRVARVLLAMPDPDRQRQGLRELADHPPTSSAERLQAYRLLASAPYLPVPETAAFVGSLPLAADAPPDEFIARSDVLVRLKPEARAELVGAVVRRLRAGSQEAQAALCAWLNRHGAQADLLAAYTPEEANRQRAVLAHWLEAMAIAGQWTELQAALAASPPVEAWRIAALRAIASARLAQGDLSRENWRRAIDETAGNPYRIRELGDLAFRVGAEEEALDAYDRLTRHPLHRVIGYRRLQQVYLRARDATRLRALMAEWSAFAPDDPTPDATFCYLSALLRMDLDKAHRRASLLVDRFPTHLGHRATLAFVELRDSQPRQALERFERTRTDLRHAPPQPRLVYALVLEANGQQALALEFARQLPTDDLLPEEQELLRRVTGKERPAPATAPPSAGPPGR